MAKTKQENKKQNPPESERAPVATATPEEETPKDKNTAVFELDYDPKAQPFKTVSGQQLTLHAIAMLDLGMVSTGLTNKAIAQGKMIDPPVIKVPIAGGSHQETIVTEKMVSTFKKQIENKSFRSSAARKVAVKAVADWEQYLADNQALAIEINAETTKVILRGVTDPLPTDHEWLLERLSLGMDDAPGFEDWYHRYPQDEQLTYQNVDSIIQNMTPTQRFDLWFFWLSTIVLVLPSELVRLQVEIMYISAEGSVSREKIAASGSTFLGELYQALEKEQSNGAAGTDDPDPAGESLSGSDQQDQEAGALAA